MVSYPHLAPSISIQTPLYSYKLYNHHSNKHLNNYYNKDTYVIYTYLINIFKQQFTYI